MKNTDAISLVQELFKNKDPNNDVFAPEKIDAAATHLNLNKAQVDTAIDAIEASGVGDRGSNGYLSINPMMASKYIK